MYMLIRINYSLSFFSWSSPQKLILRYKIVCKVGLSDNLKKFKNLSKKSLYKLVLITKATSKEAYFLRTQNMLGFMNGYSW